MALPTPPNAAAGRFQPHSNATPWPAFQTDVSPAPLSTGTDSIPHEQRNPPLPDHIKDMPIALIHRHDTLWNQQALGLNELHLYSNVVVVTTTAPGKTLAFHLLTVELKAVRTGCRVGSLHRAADHRRRPGAPPPAAPDTATILVMTPGVVHAWMLRTAHAPRIAAFLRRLRLVITGETRVPVDGPGVVAAFIFRRIAAAICSVGNPQSPRHQAATQLSVARSARGKRGGSALRQGRRDPKRRRGTHRNPAPPAPGRRREPGDWRRQDAHIQRGQRPTCPGDPPPRDPPGRRPHRVTCPLSRGDRTLPRRGLRRSRPLETRRTHPGRILPQPISPRPCPPIGCLFHEEEDGGEGHAGSAADRTTLLSFTEIPATGPGAPGWPSRPQRRGRTGPGQPLRSRR